MGAGWGAVSGKETLGGTECPVEGLTNAPEAAFWLGKLTFYGTTLRSCTHNCDLGLRTVVIFKLCLSKHFTCCWISSFTAKAAVISSLKKWEPVPTTRLCWGERRAHFSMLGPTLS